MRRFDRWVKDALEAWSGKKDTPEPDNFPVFGDVDEGAKTQMRRTLEHPRAVAGAIMADGHKGYGVPIGGVVGYEDAISPTGVGYDIGCGNKAVRLDIPAAEVRARISTIMDDVWRTVSFGMGRTNKETVDHPIFDKDHPGWEVAGLQEFKRKAQDQLGTVGSGNHYVDIFVDELDRVWVGVHFGSRGLGHRTATFFLKAAGAVDAMDTDPVVFNRGSAMFDDYIAGMRLAGEYAYAGRDWVCDRVAKLLGAGIMESVHNHHNFAWKEVHGGKDLWVVRKGATPAFPFQKGFVGGSMGENSVILEGMSGNEVLTDDFADQYLQKATMFSTVHGAGRVMGRKQAVGVIKKGRVVRPGLVTQEMMDKWVKEEAHVELRGGGLDESPHCYKRLPEVLAAHAGTVRILHTLTPLGVAMAGHGEFDPYKD